MHLPPHILVYRHLGRNTALHFDFNCKPSGEWLDRKVSEMVTLLHSLGRIHTSFTNVGRSRIYSVRTGKARAEVWTLWLEDLVVSDSVECILIEVKADKYSLGGSPTLSQRSRTTKTDTHPHWTSGLKRPERSKQTWRAHHPTSRQGKQW